MNLPQQRTTGQGILTRGHIAWDFSLGNFDVSVNCIYKSERWSTARLRTVLGGVRKNPTSFPLINAPSRADLDHHLIHSSLDSSKSICRSVKPFLQGSPSLQTDRQTKLLGLQQ